MDRLPFLVALRTLGRIGIGCQPVAADVDALRQSVAPQDSELPTEELCYLVIKRELNTAKKACGQWLVNSVAKSARIN
jgi:hypothetical protein